MLLKFNIFFLNFILILFMKNFIIKKKKKKKKKDSYQKNILNILESIKPPQTCKENP